MSQFKNLFSPFRIHTMEVSNRIVMPPMATYYADTEGVINERHIAYYVERVKGGVGYVTFEHTGVLKSGRASPRMALISTDDHVSGFKKLAEAIHDEGGKLVIQINHAGRQTSAKVTGAPIVAPSAVPCPVMQEMPRALNAAVIQEIVEAFALAAARVKAAGADGVELHMAHGYLMNQFLSPVSNHRTDEYGGGLEGRLRMPLEVLGAVRKKIGKDYPVICRISADDYLDGGLQLEETRKVAQALEQNGADAIHVSAGHYASSYMIQPSYYLEEGTLAHLAEGIKTAVDVPVIAVGRIRTPQLGDEIIATGKADLVSMGRSLIADPHLPRKAREGRLEEIVPCLSDNGCAQSLVKEGGLRCIVNPEVGHETQFKVRQAARQKKVWVIGGGPAGMKVAQIAAMRGHDVTLYEKKERLGGRFVLAAVPPGKQVLQQFIDYLIRQVDQQKVRVITGRPFDPSLLEKGKPEVVIVATGSQTALPSIPGIESADVVTDEQTLGREVDLGEKRLVVGGGGIGAEVADYISERGKQVTLVEMREGIALDLHGHQQYFLYRRLKEKGVTMLTSTKAVRFEGKDLVVEGPQGVQKLEGFDQIVISMGSKSNDELVSQLKGKVPKLYVIGDALQPRHLMEATFEAEDTALKI